MSNYEPDIRLTFEKSTKEMREMILEKLDGLLRGTGISPSKYAEYLDEFQYNLEDAKSVDDLQDIFHDAMSKIRMLDHNRSPINNDWKTRDEEIDAISRDINRRLEIFGDVVDSTNRRVAQISEEYAERLEDIMKDDKFNQSVEYSDLADTKPEHSKLTPAEGKTIYDELSREEQEPEHPKLTPEEEKAIYNELSGEEQEPEHPKLQSNKPYIPTIVIGYTPDGGEIRVTPDVAKRITQPDKYGNIGIMSEDDLKEYNKDMKDKDEDKRNRGKVDYLRDSI